ncbi:MAG TPA: DUF4178 domain-containing protein [Pyrinomonadaceae bacterium]|nr:DUF4178 domain-containing protein [Pyrinomonadaceae bacterium]
MAYQAGCPACGAQVLFKSGSSVVVVCEFCHSAVARTDRGVEDLGRVADVTESGSPLDLGLGGLYRGLGFQLTGRAQLSHSAGGFWDEWYALFTDGGWGWLAEAQGRFYLTFPAAVAPGAVPPFDYLQVGQPVPGLPSQNQFVAAEKGVAQYVAAEGEIPYKLVPGEHVRYADLSGMGGEFGTIDYSEDQPLLFLGREVTLEELGLANVQHVREREARQVQAAQLNCPQCAGPLELRAPDRAERVGCPNCGSLLDVNQGRLRYLKTLRPPPQRMSIPLGAAAEFEGRPQTVIGFVVRSVEFDGVRYFWQEYLLYNPATGFRWLVESDGHWSYVRAVPPGEVSANGRAGYGGRSFKKFQDATARVEFVTGEFYWKVEAGELARATDYVAAPQMLSREVPVGPGAQEVNWSLGTYVPVKEIEGKFSVNLPRPTGVAPNQPFLHKKVYGYWLALTALALFAGIFFLIAAPRQTVFDQTYELRATASPAPSAAAAPATMSAAAQVALAALPTPAPNASAADRAEYERMKSQILAAVGGSEPFEGGNESTQVIFTEPFRLRGLQNVRVSADADVENNWLYVAGDLINEETGLVQAFDLPVEYYAGVEDGESWTEGGRDQSAHLAALPEGTYTMRLEAQWEKWNKPTPPRLHVKIEQGVPRVLNLILVLVALAVVPFLVALRHLSFERRRWADSAFNPYGSGGDDGGGDDD